MMFQGAYTNEFYRALHDALHAQIDSWNSGAASGSATQQHSHVEPIDLWKRVMSLEQTCRNPRPTVLSSHSHDHLAQLQAPVYATSFDELLSVLAS
jgi:hypothetical protein